MGARRRCGVGGVLVALVFATGTVSADTLKERARFREGPSVDAALIGTLPAGTELVVSGDERGWKKVTAPDGTVGWIWGDHLAQAAASAEEPGGRETTSRPAVSGPRAVAEELHELRAEIAALRARPAPASAADLERLRSEIDRLVAEQRTLARRLDDARYPGAGGDPPADRPFPSAVVALVAGVAGGFAVGRFARRRRERRMRSRLSF